MKNESFHATGGARVGVAQRPPLDPQKYREKTPKTCMNGENVYFKPWSRSLVIQYTFMKQILNSNFYSMGFAINRYIV